jgi:hypothetical protein
MAIEDLDSKEELMRFIREALESEPLPQSAIDGLQQQITAGKWEPLTLLNGFANVGSPYFDASYRTIAGGGIALTGVIAKATETMSGTVIATVPKGSAPRESIQVAVEVYTGAALVTNAILVNAAGEIQLEGTVSAIANMSLHGAQWWPGS